MSRTRSLAGLFVVGALLAAGCATDAPTAASPATRLADARAQAGSLTSFAFRSVTELPGKDALQRTVVDGRAVVPDRVAYAVTVGATRTEVVRIGEQGYTRTLPGGTWKAEPGTVSSPTPAVVLQRVLAAADVPVDRGDVTFDGRSARGLDVTLTADEVRSTGLLQAAGGSDVRVGLALDARGRVVRLAVEIPVQGGGTGGVLRQVTTYGDFGTAAPVEAPV